jgi:predicted nucleotidyltransferase
MKKAELDNVVQLITEQIPSVEVIYLFGSMANGMDSRESDVDIAFLTPFECKVNPIDVSLLKGKLEILLGKDVDLIHLNVASIVFQFQITTTSKQLYVKNASLVLQYEVLVLSMYQRLQEERQGILKEIILSGKVYA